MANLWTGRINPNGTFQDLSNVSGITFTNGNKYQIQIQNSANIREGETGEGFYWDKLEPIIYEHKGNSLYIKPNWLGCVVNIAES